MLIGYARVSTDDQDLRLQSAALKEAGCRHTFAEKVSGAKRDRPELARMIDQLRDDDVVVVTRLDRLARSTKDLLDIAEKLNEAGAGLRSLAELWADTTSPTGRMVADGLRRYRGVRTRPDPPAHQKRARRRQGAGRALRSPAQAHRRPGCARRTPGRRKHLRSGGSQAAQVSSRYPLPRAVRPCRIGAFQQPPGRARVPTPPVSRPSRPPHQTVRISNRRSGRLMTQAVHEQCDHSLHMVRTAVMGRHAQARGRVEKFVGVDVASDRTGRHRRLK